MIDDWELAGCLATDLDAHFEQLVRTFQHRLYGFALRLTSSPQDAEECTQDAFVRAYRALQRYPAEQVQGLRLRPWLYQITLNIIRNRVRRPEPARVDLEQPAAVGLASATRDEQPEPATLSGETQRELARALGALPERYATAIVLRHVQGLSYADAAEILDQPVGTIKSDVHRGLRLLREALEPTFLLAGDR